MMESTKFRGALVADRSISAYALTMTDDASSEPGSESILRLKVRLQGLSPMVWRRVLVPEATSLRELHGVLQAVMG